MECVLGDIADVTMGQSPKSEFYNTDGQGMPFLQGNRTFGKKYPVFDTYTTMPTKTAKAGDVIMSVRAPVGDLNVTPVDMCLGRGVCGIRMKNGNQDFLFYLLKYYMPHLVNKESGTVFGSVNRNDINGLAIKIPDSFKEQRRIARMLAVFDEKIENNEAINENLLRQTCTLFHSMFISSDARQSWERGTFSDLIESTLGGDWGKEYPVGNHTQKVYCIRGSDIPAVKTGNKGKMPTRYIIPKNYATKRLLPGDIVVEISGGSPTQSTGRVAPISQSLLDRYDQGMVCTNFCRAIKPKQGYCMFVYHYWQYLYNRNVFFLYENGTTGIKNLDLTGFINTEEIVLPPATLVEQFDDFCHSLFDQIFALGLENELLSTLRDALLPRLMSGELDVSKLDL